MQIATRTPVFQAPAFPQLPSATPNAEPAPVPNDRQFANLLQRSQPTRPAPLPAPVAAPAEPDRAAAPQATDDGPAAPDEATPAQRQRLAPKAPARSTAKAAPGPAPEEAQAAHSRTTATDEASPDTGAAPNVPDTTNWQVPLPPPPTTMPATAGGREALPAVSDEAATGTAAAGGGPRGRAALPAADDASLGAASAQAARAATDGSEQALESALELAAAEATDSGAGASGMAQGGPNASNAPNSFATLLAGAGPQGSAREAAPATTASATLPTPTTAPEFAQSLGVQVSVFAREGVQQAELHLNPAETGPVSVQIVLDGNQARVDFGADLAATRSAIEAGLPELAAALREAGFTLSGGGVSQHAGGRSDPGASRDGNGGNAQGPRDAAADPVTRPQRSRASAGGVDLYA